VLATSTIQPSQKMPSSTAAGRVVHGPNKHRDRLPLPVQDQQRETGEQHIGAALETEAKHSAGRSSGSSVCHPRDGETSSQWIDVACCNDAPRRSDNEDSKMDPLGGAAKCECSRVSASGPRGR
jgi:hypothetical protein